MAHVPYEELRRRLAEAAEMVELGGRYAHYKHPDKPYRVVDFTVREEDDEVAVIYEPEHEPGVRHDRKLSVWLEETEHEGKLVPRFIKL